MLKLTLLVGFLLINCILTLTDNSAYLRCLDSKSHKPNATEEDTLKGECKRWKSLSCCNSTTAETLHDDNNYWYGFNIDHCYRLSTKCRRRFRQELCFYECDPYLGLWIVQVKYY